MLASAPPPGPPLEFPLNAQFLKVAELAPPPAKAALLVMVQLLRLPPYTAPPYDAELAENAQLFNVESLAPPPVEPAKLLEKVQLLRVAP